MYEVGTCKINQLFFIKNQVRILPPFHLTESDGEVNYGASTPK